MESSAPGRTFRAGCTCTTGDRAGFHRSRASGRAEERTAMWRTCCSSSPGPTMSRNSILPALIGRHRPDRVRKCRPTSKEPDRCPSGIAVSTPPQPCQGCSHPPRYHPDQAAPATSTCCDRPKVVSHRHSNQQRLTVQTECGTGRMEERSVSCTHPTMLNAKYDASLPRLLLGTLTARPNPIAMIRSLCALPKFRRT